MLFPISGYYPNDHDRPYVDEFGEDELFRYKWRGTDPNQADNRNLRAAMDQGLPLLWLVGVGYKPGSKQQVFQPVMPVWLIAEEPERHQFVVALDEDQRALAQSGEIVASEVERRYNSVLARRRLHQPLFQIGRAHV